MKVLDNWILLAAIILVAGISFSAGYGSGKSFAESAAKTEQLELSKETLKSMEKKDKEIKAQSKYWRDFYADEIKSEKEQKAELQNQLNDSRITGERLRGEVGKLLKNKSSNADGNSASASGKRETGGTTDDLLSNVFDGLDSSGREIAVYADNSRERAERCERYYNALIGQPPEVHF